MQDDIRPVVRLRPRDARCSNLTQNRRIPKVGRPEGHQFSDVVISKNATVSKCQKRDTAPKAEVYHVDTHSAQHDALPQRAVHIQSKTQWLKKMRRRSIVKRVKYNLKSSAVMYTAAFVVFAAGMTVTAQSMVLNSQVKEQTQVLSAKVSAPSTSAVSGSSATAESSQEVPSEQKPKPNYIDTYKVASDLPRLLSIQSIGVRTRVLQVGVDANNQLLTPKSVYDTAWYNGSSKPGEMGAAVIDGHYVGPTARGVFSKLHQLKNDSEVVIERGDGKQLKFKVVAVETMPLDKLDMSKVMQSIDPSAPGLNLITCSGKYDAKSFEFADRTVVYTVMEK